MNCPSCHGTGAISNGPAHDSDWSDCPDCDGSGHRCEVNGCAGETTLRSGMWMCASCACICSGCGERFAVDILTDLGDGERECPACRLHSAVLTLRKAVEALPADDTAALRSAVVEVQNRARDMRRWKTSEEAA